MQNKYSPHRKLRALLLLVFLFALPVVCQATKPSAEEQIRILNASRVIPDEENAAITYLRIAELYPGPWHPNEVSADDMRTTSDEPWLSVDYPEIASWIESHMAIVDELRLATEIEKCVFPLTLPGDSNSNEPEESWQESWSSKFRRWVLFLERAAFNDLAEGKISNTIDKIHILERLSEHSRQQPTSIGFLVYVSCQAVAANLQTILITSGDVSDVNLDNLKANMQSTENTFNKYYNVTLDYEKLVDELSPRQRYRGDSGEREDAHVRRHRDLYLRMLSTLRAQYILIELRRFKNKTGKWPNSLEQIKNTIPSSEIVDPISNKIYKYKTTGNEFILYSIGSNGSDEGGHFILNGADDWPIYNR